MVGSTKGHSPNDDDDDDRVDIEPPANSSSVASSSMRCPLVLASLFSLVGGSLLVFCLIVFALLWFDGFGVVFRFKL